MRTDLDYSALDEWHRQALKRYLEPARLSAVRQITELLDAKIPAADRPRFRVSASRIKTPQRLLTKLLRAKYLDRFTGYEDIPGLIDDLVGIRIICNNLSDVNTLQELLGELPEIDDPHPPLAVERASHRDYFAEPKPSGYRAYHVNLVVPVPQAYSTRAVRVEVQVRTLLQDGWGELTHEDTYKPGSKVPEWIITMSSRMAELLAAVDNIAQDLRVGLDAEAAKGLSQDPIEVKSVPNDEAVSSTRTSPADPVHAALEVAAAKLVKGMRTTRSLAAVSQELISQFGNDIAPSWAGYGSFKAFIQGVCPDAEITPPSPGYLHPPGALVAEGWYTDEATIEQQVPEFIRELRTYVKSVPLISRARWRSLVSSTVDTLAASAGPAFGDQFQSSQIEPLARSVRDRAAEKQELVVLPHAAFVLRALSANQQFKPNITSNEVEAVLFAMLIQTATQNNLISDPYEAKQQLEGWIGSEPAGQVV